MNTVLLTGASGFVGSHCIARLVERGFDVHCVSRVPRDDRRVRWHRADLLDADARRVLLRGIRPSHLLHLAWVATPSSYRGSEENLLWLNASSDLFSEFVRAGGQRAVLAGTCGEYDPSHGPCRETTPLRPSTLYSASKAALSLLLPFLPPEGERCSYAWARLFHLFGPREHPARVLPAALRSLLAGVPFDCTHGRQLRDFLFVEDAASALVASLGSEVQGPVNIASGSPRRLTDLLGLAGSLLGRRELLRFGALPAPTDEPEALTADVARLRHEVKWAPCVPFEEGVQRTVAWWQQRRE